jgi:hypothetical protein
LKRYTVVDSNKTKLPAPEILMRAVDQANTDSDMDKLPLQVKMAAVMQQIAMPGTEVTHIGNTVYIGNVGKGKLKTHIHVYGNNLDTGANYLKNTVEYMKKLKQKGMTHFTTDITPNPPKIIDLANELIKQLNKLGMEAFLGANKDKSYYRLYVRFTPKVKDSEQ